MKVQFVQSQEEIVDATMRFYARSKVVSEMQQNNVFWMALVAGLLLFALFRFSGKGLIGGMIAAMICILAGPWYYRYAQRKSVGKVLRESYGDENEFVCTVELLPEGLKTNSINIESIAPWETLEVVTTSDSVDIFSRRGGVVVRNRAFSSNEERDRFIDLVRSSINRARGENQR